MNAHTPLFLSDADAERLKRHTADPKFSSIWRSALRTAERIVELRSVSFPEDTMELWYVLRNRAIDLCIALRATGDRRYAEALHEILADLASRDTDFWQGPHYPNRPRTQMIDGAETLVGELETAYLTMGLAIIYDVAYDDLSSDDHALILRLLRERSYPLLGASVRLQSKKWVMNHLCVIASAWTLALLLLPERHDDDMRLACHAMNLWMSCVESDGSYGEGYHYFAFPLNSLFFALLALRNARGIRLEQEGHATRAFEWAIYHQVGIQREAGYEKPVAMAVNFHDCPRVFQMEAPEALLFANLMDNPIGQWYIDRFLLTDLSRPDESLSAYWQRADSLLLALYRDEQPAMSPEQAGLAHSRCFFDTGYQFLRSGWTMEDDLVFAMESGGGTRCRSHEHFDRNSFLLYAGGELFLADPGHSCYRGISYQTFDTCTNAHATWTLNGQNQSLAYLEQGMSSAEARAYPSFNNAALPSQQLHKEITLITSQANRCYRPAWKDYTRRAFLVYNKYVLLWDSVDTGDQQGVLTCPLTLNTRDGQMRIQQENTSVRLIRPGKELYMNVIVPEGGLSLGWEEGVLHDSYHIRAGMEVEGALGSAKRLVLRTDASRLDCLLLLCPLGHGEQAPLVQAERIASGILVTIRHAGNKDTFILGSSEIAYAREGGAQYAF